MYGRVTNPCYCRRQGVWSIEFSILGPLEAHDGDRLLDLGGARQRALLALLLLHPNEVVSRDRLVEDLWGSDGPDLSSKALQVAVSRLRRALEPGLAAGEPSRLLVTRPPGYQLCLEPGQLDLQRFEQQVADGRQALASGDPAAATRQLAAALALWRGAPLADLTYESFAQESIERLEELRAAALEERVAAELQLGRHAELVGELSTLARRYPLRERLRELLMLALYRSGRQAEALAAYRGARQELVEQLGIEPGAALQRLEKAILVHDPALAAQPPLAADPPAQPSDSTEGTSPTDVGPGALVGRRRELNLLLGGLEEALAGRGGVFLVTGEAGIGKSRLLDELARCAGGREVRVLWGRCWEAGGAPAYWPWVQSLRAYLGETDPEALRSQIGRGGAELATILPELRELLPDLPPAPPSGSERARFRLLESVASFLTSAARAEPLAIFLDDLHAADVPSLLVLRFVARMVAREPILIVGCYRDTEVSRDLAEALPELTREAAVRRVSLKGLSSSDTARLLEVATGQVPPDELAMQVHAETEGNPLFAGEVGRLLASEGRFEQTEAVEEGLPIPEGVREAIGRRVEDQSGGCGQVLTLASAFGREFDLDALQRVTGLEEDELFEALDEASSARLVGGVPGASGRLRFSHVLIRDTLYHDLPATRRLRLHRRIAEALEALHTDNLEPHLAELAHHYLEAGNAGVGKAIQYAALAGDRAASQLAHEEAARHYRGALRLLETSGPGDEERKGELLLSLGDVLSRAGEGSEGKDAFRRAAATAESSGQLDQLARAALGYGGRFAWARSSSDAALVPLLERALQAVSDHDSPARIRLLARLSYAARDEPLRDRRIALAREAVEMARRIGDPVTLAYALEGWSMAEGPDNVERRIAGADELISLADRIGDMELAYTGHEVRLHTFWTLGDRAGIDVELDSLSSLADDLRQPAQWWLLSSMRTMLALMEGHFERAEQQISETLALGQRAESWNSAVSHRVQLFVLRREQGRLAELEDTILRSVHEYPTLPRFRFALAHLYGELGRAREARAAFDQILSRDLGREHLDEEWLFGMSMLPDVCAFLGDSRAAARLYSLLLPYKELYTEAPVEATFGSIAYGLGVLATKLRRFDDAERHFYAAIETEHRMRARPWLAHAQHGFAAMLLARDGPADRKRASGLLAEALGTYRDLEMEIWEVRATALSETLDPR